jgi:spermidine synthase
VRLVVDDGRAFLNRTRERYDLIVFALTDSLVKVSPVTQLRLENYVFTEESLARAFRVLAPGGDLVFYNFYREPWLVENRSTSAGRLAVPVPPRARHPARLPDGAGGRCSACSSATSRFPSTSSAGTCSAPRWEASRGTRACGSATAPWPSW